jgi:type II secretory pathway component PulF
LSSGAATGYTSLAAIVVVAAVARLLGGRAGWSWLIGNLPLIGRAWHWTGVAEMFRCLSLLIEHRVPLPEALRLTAGGISDAYVAQQCRLLAGRVEQGTSLTMSLVNLRTLPLSIVPLVRWGEQSDSLAPPCSAAEMIGRLEMRGRLLIQIIPPIVFVLVGGTVASASSPCSGRS